VEDEKEEGDPKTGTERQKKLEVVPGRDKESAISAAELSSDKKMSKGKNRKPQDDVITCRWVVTRDKNAQ